MTDKTKMKELLSDPQNTDTIARIWPILEPILLEQHRVSVSKDDPCPKELKGQTIVYKALRKFKQVGEEDPFNKSK